MDSSKKKHWIQVISIVLLCILCFGMGMAIPIVKNHSKIDKVEKEKFDSIYSILKNEWYYANDVNGLDKKLMEQAIMGMTTLEKDPHTNYFDLDQAKQFSASLEGSNVGLGVNFFEDENGNMAIKQVFINSPADRANLKAGDVIVQVGDKVCAQTSQDDLVTYIKDRKGKSVDITYLENGVTNKTKITPTEFDSTVICNLYDTYGEIILTSFSEHSGEDVAKAMKRIREAGLKSVLLDLRDNSGGYLSAAVDIASTFVPEKSVVFKEKKKDGSIVATKTNEKYSQVKMDKIVILQNTNTASASEALIGALKDILKDKVVTVGTNTYGKGTEQVSVPFRDGTSLKYTIAEWLTPNENCINKKGFKPDIEVEDSVIKTVKYMEFKKDDVIQRDTVSQNARALQVFLNYLGYTTDRKDAYFSVVSSDSLKDFQSENGLDVTGNCDKKTWDLLFSKAVLKLNNNFNQEDAQRNIAIAQF